ncbi:MAG TPA: hypothetical protein DD435_03070 [Cyanobacteria bacterium UBA8530]|nr:hypothetical protein [Cyanobacteria bacterium UBA8530]
MRALSSDFIEEKKIWGWLYFLVFPLDFFFAPEDPDGVAFQEEKYSELFPVFLWLLPLAVLLTNTVSIGAVGMFFLFGVLSAMLSVLTSYHLRLEAGKTIEILLNLWAGLILISLSLFLLAFLLGIFIENEI